MPARAASETAPGFGAFAPTGAQALLLAAAHATPLKRGSFRPALSRLLGAIRPGPIDAAFQGGSFRFHHRDSATERGALLNPGYDATELDFLREALPPGGVAVDIGANVGIYAIPLARRAGPGGRVLAVEPHPVAHQRLAFNVRASGLKNLTLVAAAVGAADGEVAIKTDGPNLGASRVAALGEASSLNVSCRTLVRLLHAADLRSVEALKIDVEGFEDQVLCPFLRDAPPSLWPKAIVIEHLSAADWLENPITAIVARGYRIVARTRSNTLLRRQAGRL